MISAAAGTFFRHSQNESILTGSIRAHSCIRGVNEYPGMLVSQCFSRDLFLPAFHLRLATIRRFSVVRPVIAGLLLER